jgi:hypothetical protein
VTKVCQVANLYPQYFQVAALADAKINSYADLKGKSLVTQPRATRRGPHRRDPEGERPQLPVALEGQLPGFLHRRGVDAQGRARAGDDAGHHGAASAIMDLASARDVTLVPVDDKTMAELKKSNAGTTS